MLICSPISPNFPKISDSYYLIMYLPFLNAPKLLLSKYYIHGRVYELFFLIFFIFTMHAKFCSQSRIWPLLSHSKFTEHAFLREPC
jgi:hypothetical protein